MHGHRHDPNPHPPSTDPSFRVLTPDGRLHPLDLAALQALPSIAVDGCYIVSTGHGTSGPFTFQGARLADLVHRCWGHRPWSQVQVISGDGFGTVLDHAEVGREVRPPLLAYRVDGRPMTRAEGLVRLILPDDLDDALRQVKWVAEIRILASERP